MDANVLVIDRKRENDGYTEFLETLLHNFTRIATNAYALFTVNVEGLWELFLDNLPDDARQHYTCNSCRSFVNHYGNIVVIDESGVVKSALWDVIVPEFFQPSINAMNNAVRKAAKVNGVFISDCVTLGHPKTGVWQHMSVQMPSVKVNRSRTKNAYQIMAEKHEDFRTLINAIQEFPLEIAEQAVSLLQTNAMYRSDRVLGVAEWFKKLHDDTDALPSVQRTNLIWFAVATAPNGFCHVKSSMIGTLLEDIKASYSTRMIMARFQEKMNPQNYMRSQYAPTVSAIEQAEKLVEKLGIANSMCRKYATFHMIAPFCEWIPKTIESKTTKVSGVFANVTPREKLSVHNTQITMPSTTMTYDKFMRTVLPTADKIEVLVDNPSRFMAMVTEAIEGSENILQWDNPFSWYYHGGIDGEIKRRVEAAGGRYENCEIRCSLIWENYTDLDLHCITPTSHIYFGDKKDRTGGWLDVDANGGIASTNKPVENIRWASNARDGHYKFYVNNYCDRNYRENPFRVELEVAGQVYNYNGFMRSTGENEVVFEFDYRNGKVTNMKTPSSTITSGSDMWNLQMNQFVNVKGIVNSPNTWDKQHNPTNGQHIFFILDGCKDTSEGKGRGFFNEILKPELREIRKTLEVYTANTPIEGIDYADACGVGYLNGSDWDLTIRVTSGKSQRVIKIDRFD